MGSTRLPGKVLTEIAGRPMLWHVVQRAKRAQRLDHAIVATSEKPEDDTVAAFCTESDIACFRGSEGDVLDRYYQAARKFIDATTIVRITADCPLVDPQVIDKVVETYQDGPYDYVTNVLPRTYPDGLDVEVFSLAALERAWSETGGPYPREHVTFYLREHPDLFRIGNVMHQVDLSAMRWTVDYPQDMHFVRTVYDHMIDGSFGLTDVLELLEAHPELIKINSDIHRLHSQQEQSQFHQREG